MLPYAKINKAPENLGWSNQIEKGEIERATFFFEFLKIRVYKLFDYKLRNLKGIYLFLGKIIYYYYYI